MLTSKQRAFLRSLANPIDSIFQIGKGGINGQLIKQVDETLTAREIIKIKVLETSPVKAKEACAELSEKTSSQPVQVIGSKFVIYRENKKLEERIKLPK